MNKIYALVAGNAAVQGLVKFQTWLKGKRTYLAGSIMILQGLTCLLDQVTGWGGLADALTWLRGLGDNGCVTQISEGLGLMGLRAALSQAKAQAALAAPSSAEQNPQS